MEMLRLQNSHVTLSAGLQHFALYLKMYDQMVAYCQKINVPIEQHEDWEVVYKELEESGCLDLDQLEMWDDAGMDVDASTIADSDL